MRKAENIGSVIILFFFTAHLYCYLTYLNGGKSDYHSINLYYVSMYSTVITLCIALQIIAKSQILYVVTGSIMAVCNSFLLVEFLGKPELWGYAELFMFISTIAVSFLASIVLHLIKPLIKK